MEYKEVECRLVDHGIREYQKFKGIKIYSNSRFSEDRKKIIYQTIYLTPKKNLVYYQREDFNYDSEWWLRKHQDLPFYHQQEADTVFKICQAFAELSSYLDKSTINKLEQKLAAGAFIETLNI